MQEEIWKNTEFDGYMISNLGRVSHNGRILSTKQNKHNYESVIVSTNPAKRVYVHRLVAKAFILNPYHKKEVNHINGNKKDNRAENLEWVSSAENKIHARDVLGKFMNNKRCKKVLCIELKKEFSSMCEACRFFGDNTNKGGGIGTAIKIGCKVKGYHWKYI